MKNILLFVAITFVACNPGKDYEGLATELCDCMQPTLELSKRLENIDLNAQDSLQTQAIINEIERLQEQSMLCADEIEAKIGEVNEEDNAKLNAALKKVCPEIAKMMDNQEF